MKIKKQIAVSDTGFIFNPDTGESFTANPIGLEVLEMLKEGLDFDTLRNNILDKYNAESDIVERDFKDFIGMLKQFNLIEQDGEEEN